MRIIDSSAELEVQSSYDEKDILLHIEKIGRTAYKSEHKICEGSAEKLIVKTLFRLQHEAVVEHGNIIILTSSVILNFIENNPYFRVTPRKNNYVVSGNVRAWRDLFRKHPAMKSNMEDLYPVLFSKLDIKTSQTAILLYKKIDSLSIEEQRIHQRITVRFICDRGVSHELVRHRILSFLQESTRYCNYFADKFGFSLTFIRPSFYDKKGRFLEKLIWKIAMKCSEIAYRWLIRLGSKPQEARSILPNSLKTEVVVTGYVEQWKHFFSLRDAKPAHPQMKELATPLHQKFRKTFPVFFP